MNLNSVKMQQSHCDSNPLWTWWHPPSTRFCNQVNIEHEKNRLWTHTSVTHWIIIWKLENRRRGFTLCLNAKKSSFCFDYLKVAISKNYWRNSRKNKQKQNWVFLPEVNKRCRKKKKWAFSSESRSHTWCPWFFAEAVKVFRHFCLIWNPIFCFVKDYFIDFETSIRSQFKFLTLNCEVRKEILVEMKINIEFKKDEILIQQVLLKTDICASKNWPNFDLKFKNRELFFQSKWSILKCKISKLPRNSQLI